MIPCCFRCHVDLKIYYYDQTFALRSIFGLSASHSPPLVSFLSASALAKCSLSPSSSLCWNDRMFW